MTKRQSKKSQEIIIPDTQLITATGRSISIEDMEEIRQMVFDGIGMYMMPTKFQELMTPPPAYAIQTRPDGYPYLKHGYVRLKMLEIFGMDWDFEILPVYNNQPYQLIPPDDKMATPASVITFGKLTLRLNPLDNNGKPMLEHPMVKVISGSGTADWRRKMPFGKAINAAESSTFRRCAMPLGPALGLTLYWNDDAMFEEHEKSERVKRENANLLARMQEDAIPTSLKELWERTGLNVVTAAPILGCEITEVAQKFKDDPNEVWSTLKGESK